MLNFGPFGCFYTEVNPEMIPNLSRRAAERLKIDILILKCFIFLKIENINIFKLKLLFLDSQRPAESAKTLRSQRPIETG
jgi:hypothetical protein